MRIDTFRCGLLRILSGSDCDELATADFAAYYAWKEEAANKKHCLWKARSQPQTSQQDDNYLSSQFLRLRQSQQ